MCIVITRAVRVVKSAYVGVRRGQLQVFGVLFGAGHTVATPRPCVPFLIEDSVTCAMAAIVQGAFRIVSEAGGRVFPFEDFLGVVRPSARDYRPGTSVLIFVWPMGAVVARTVGVVFVVFRSDGLGVNPLLFYRGGAVPFNHGPGISIEVLRSVVEGSPWQSTEFNCVPLFNRGALGVWVEEVGFGLAVPFSRPSTVFTVFGRHACHVKVRIVAIARTKVGVRLTSWGDGLLRPLEVDAWPGVTLLVKWRKVWFVKGIPVK